MFLKVTDAIKGLRQLPKVYNALGENVTMQAKLLRLSFKNYKRNLQLAKSLSCNINTLASYYKHMGYYHLEVLTHTGTLLHRSHRIDDIYPNITVLDKNDKTFKNLEILLDKSLCKLNYINLDYNTEVIDLNIKFNSISLPFVLESLQGGIENIENFLINLKTQLDPYNSVVFGVIALAKGLKSQNKKFPLYLDFLQKQKIYFNQDLTLDLIYQLFQKHFEHVALHYEGSCLFFVLEAKLEKLKLKPVLPKSDPLKMPFV